MADGEAQFNAARTPFLQLQLNDSHLNWFGFSVEVSYIFAVAFLVEWHNYFHLDMTKNEVVNIICLNCLFQMMEI